MLGLLLVSGFLTGVSPWGQPVDRREVSLNESCRKQVLQHVGKAVLHLLRLAHPPRFPENITSQVQEAWAKEVEEEDSPSLSSWGQHLNVTFNQTLLIQRGACSQVSHHITLADLGWQPWVFHPRAFIFTECLGCPCQRREKRPPLWTQGCQLGVPGNQLDVDTKQLQKAYTTLLCVSSSQQPCERRCCRPQYTPLVFMFLDQDGSMVLRPVHLVQDCRCHP